MFVDAHVHLNRYGSTETVLVRAGRAGVRCVTMTESPSDFDAWAPVLRERSGVHLTWSKKSRVLRGLGLSASGVGWRASRGSDGGSD